MFRILILNYLSTVQQSANGANKCQRAETVSAKVNKMLSVAIQSIQIDNKFKKTTKLFLSTLGNAVRGVNKKIKIQNRYLQ